MNMNCVVSAGSQQGHAPNAASSRADPSAAHMEEPEHAVSHNVVDSARLPAGGARIQSARGRRSSSHVDRARSGGRSVSSRLAALPLVMLYFDLDNLAVMYPNKA